MIAPMYVKRKVLNHNDLTDWAKSVGMTSALHPDDFHVTVAFIRERVDHNALELDQTPMVLVHNKSNYRSLARFGATLSLKFFNAPLKARHNSIFDGFGLRLPAMKYRPHISLTYRGIPDNWQEFEPFYGDIHLGPETSEILDPSYRPRQVMLNEV